MEYTLLDFQDIAFVKKNGMKALTEKNNIYSYDVHCMLVNLYSRLMIVKRPTNMD